MCDQTLFEKLQLKDEKNLLIQGIPSTIEKQFIKLSFAKCVTPLLKIKKIEFALVFAVSKQQLCQILSDVMPVLQEKAKLWIAYPKITSKIASDLNRDCTWKVIDDLGFEAAGQIIIDNMWTAMRFIRSEKKAHVKAAVDISPAVTNHKSHYVAVPEELKLLFRKNKPAEVFFDSLSTENRREYVDWVQGAKKTETRSRRLESVVEKLSTGKKTPGSR